jgi:hydroxyacyl-ACP dehydratase HTD2-like protein with hotdog domain
MDLAEQTRWVAAAECTLSRAMNGGNEFEYYYPVKVGDVISVTGKLVDLQERQGKNGTLLFLTCERTYRNQEERLVCKARMTFIRY